MNKWSQKIRSLGVPSQETSENLKAPEIVTDKRSWRKNGRTEQFGTRVKKEWLTDLKKIAQEERLNYVEVLEDALGCYVENIGENNEKKEKN